MIVVNHAIRSNSIPIETKASTQLTAEGYDLSTSVGGTMYATTPGGTRIIYDRDSLMALSKSPLARSPPAGMASIPGVTIDAKEEETNVSIEEQTEEQTNTEKHEEDELFQFEEHE
eukprot:TRINITY_DN451_c0_g1_i1.p1 TRINITY_DN451_c0_g1~~TRINITY_DN451_c0_g1_i1.p1  ORF type:complete len:116 (+),score=21.00 TRINITY_DN451_c0_g1_i1:140-487(+)